MTTLKYKGMGDKTSCFNIIRHALHESIGVMFEMLEIKNPPQNKPGFVLFGEDDFETYFFECNDLGQLQRLFNNLVELHEPSNKLFTKHVDCGSTLEALKPWFFAQKPENIKGDFSLNPGDSTFYVEDIKEG